MNEKVRENECKDGCSIEHHHGKELRKESLTKVKVKKKVVHVHGLNCSNCAMKIENEILKLEEIQSVQIDLVREKLTFEYNQTFDDDVIVSKIRKIVITIEPDVKVEEEGHSHDHDLVDKKTIIELAIGIILFSVALFIREQEMIRLFLFIGSYILIGYSVIIKAIKNILRLEMLDENFLMFIATIGAFLIGEHTEGVAVMLFYQVGELFQDLAVNHSRKSIQALINIRPDTANVIRNNEILELPLDEIQVGDTLLVKPGEKIALDGVIVEGITTIDLSALTGESLPKDVEMNQEVLAGSINVGALIKVKVTKPNSESTITKILTMVEDATQRKAVSERFITKFARYYTPIVVIIAILLVFTTPLLIGDSFSTSIYRALVFLVVSCPCALVISIPLGFFGGIGRASASGILIKGGNYLEALSNVSTIYFDKTGTLTKGELQVDEIITTSSYTQAEVLEFASIAEYHSNHPIAKSIVKSFGKPIDTNLITSHQELIGRGVRVITKGMELLVGNYKLMEESNVSVEQIDTDAALIYIALNQQHIGTILLSDQLKSDSKYTIQTLNQRKIETILLTGDVNSIAQSVKKELKMSNAYGDLLPNDKLRIIDERVSKKTKKETIAFIGDGINDAPSLAIADIGISMGALGSDAAIEASDLVIMNDEPSKIIEAIEIAKKTKRIVWQNIIFALGTKVIVLLLGVFGIANLWEAVFADVGVAILAILNSIRILKK